MIRKVFQHWGRHNKLRFSRTILLFAVSAARLHGQVFVVSGGSSSLYEAQGGTITAKGESYNASVGAGVIDGQFFGGANLTKVIANSTYIFGHDYIRFVLPTDVFDSSHYLVAVGAGVAAKIQNTDVFAFGGATSNSFASPLFQGFRAENPAGILFLKRRLNRTFDLTSNFVFSDQTTAIGALRWQPADRLSLAAAGGIGANQPYGAVSFDFERSWITTKAAYIETGSQFHRVAVDTPLMSEPDKGNVLVTVRPIRNLSLSGGRQNFLSPVANSNNNVASAVDQASANLHLVGTGLSASFYHSTYLGNFNNATSFIADRQFLSRIRASASFFQSRPNNAPKTQSFIASFSEIITPRLNVSEFVTHSQGQTSVSFGGGFLSNLASVTAEYQTYYVPQNNSAPFEQALIVDLQLHLLRGVSLHGATFVAPDGKLRYTADAQALAVRQGQSGAPGSVHLASQPAIASNLVHGKVVDVQGNAISGAAILIDQVLVYSNDDGEFEVRERKPHVHDFKVLGDQFLDGFAYRVISAPHSIRGTGEKEPGIVVVVERIATARK